MPEVSLFYGIRITMFYSDHNPPHFHAEYAGNKALVDIQGGFVIRGALPSRQLKLILAWCELHRDELMQNWELSKDAKPCSRAAICKTLPLWSEFDKMVHDYFYEKTLADLL